jgi:hypothetical protein
MSIFEKFFSGSDEGGGPEMQVPPEPTPEIVPATETPEINAVEGTLAEIGQEEEEDAKREQQIEDIKKKPTIH